MATVHVLHIKVGMNWAVAFPLSPGLLGAQQVLPQLSGS